MVEKVLTNEQYESKDLLRFLTCGSVDDGKSTLIGNLLYNSKRLCKDQIETLKTDTKKHGTTGEEVDYALLMDGLQSEREQGITIDVAYRYFETPKRKFIVADTPGHEQYTRNMVTGASTADLAVILVDASKGLQTQSKRHAFIVSLLQIPYVLLIVNKMDLVDYSQDVYKEIVEDFKQFARKLDIENLACIPVSALRGDNVITTDNKNTPWYKGDSFLEYLENIYVKSDHNLVDFRFPVQYVLRPNSDFRGFAGRIESGTIAPGEKILALPSGKESTIKKVVSYDGDMKEAFASQSIILTLNDEIDISRGDMIVRKNNLPTKSSEIDATICWLSEEKSDTSKRYVLKHTTKETNATITNLMYKVDVNTLHRKSGVTLELNDIARVQIESSTPLFFDNYKSNRKTGSFILIDAVTNNTVAAGMIRGRTRRAEDYADKPLVAKAKEVKSQNISKKDIIIPLDVREERNNHKGAVLWLTGYSGSGKSTIAQALVRKLYEDGKQITILDGDNVRHGLNRDLGFSPDDRSENIRRVGEVAKLLYENGFIVVCSFISPYKADRRIVREIMPKNRFFEIYVKCDIEVCKRRDPKGLYAKAIAGEIKDFTGIDAPYEEPENAEIVIESDIHDVETSTERIIKQLQESDIIM